MSATGPSFQNEYQFQISVYPYQAALKANEMTKQSSKERVRSATITLKASLL